MTPSSYLFGTVGMFFSVWVASFFSRPAAHITRKIWLYSLGMMHLVLSQDTRWNKSKLVDPNVIRGKATHSVRIFFIRHGESEWNQVFNKGFGIGFFGRLFKAIVLEVLKISSGDSLFIDSNLSQEGIQQAVTLRNALTRPLHGDDPDIAGAIALLKGETGKSILISSNLRRAAATATVALLPRLQKTGEKIRIVSYLQEVSRNVDTLCLAEHNRVPEMSEISKAIGNTLDLEHLFDVRDSRGNKPLSGRGIDRLNNFAKWAFEQGGDCALIVTGHSLWFKHFFNTFLPKSDDYAGKKRKMVNCGVIGFTLEKGIHEGKTIYRIQPESLMTVHGGFS